MSFDYLTLTGVLVTLLYIVMLAMFRSKAFTPGLIEGIALNLTDDEPYRYGT